MTKLRMFYILSLVILGILIWFTVFKPMLPSEEYSTESGHYLIQTEDEYIIKFDIANHDGKDTNYTINVSVNGKRYSGNVMILNGSVFTYFLHIYRDSVIDAKASFTIYKASENVPFEQGTFHLSDSGSSRLAQEASRWTTDVIRTRSEADFTPGKSASSQGISQVHAVGYTDLEKMSSYLELYGLSPDEEYKVVYYYPDGTKQQEEIMTADDAGSLHSVRGLAFFRSEASPNHFIEIKELSEGGEGWPIIVIHANEDAPPIFDPEWDGIIAWQITAVTGEGGWLY